MNVSKACMWPSMSCIIFLLANSPWLRNSKAFSGVAYLRSCLIPLSKNRRMQSPGDIFLSQKAWRTTPALQIHFSGQTIYCCLVDPVNLNDPCDSLKETLELKWSIVFHGLCPNDWWHFLRHLQRRPLANLERHLNAKISPRHEQSHIVSSQRFTLACVCMSQVWKGFIELSTK